MGLKFSEAWARRLNNDVGDHVRHTPNSQAILAAGLRLYRAADCRLFRIFGEEFSSCGF